MARLTTSRGCSSSTNRSPSRSRRSAPWPRSASESSGRGIDGSHAPASGAYVGQYGDGGKHWERDIDLKYVVQSGAAKDLSLSFSHVSHRANQAQAGDDIDRIYLIIEYPLKGSF